MDTTTTCEIELGTLVRYGDAPTDLLMIALVMLERGEVFGMECLSGHGGYKRIADLQPITQDDFKCWQDHETYRQPYLAYYQHLIRHGNDMDDISLDCETLSTQPNAALLSIAAVQFNRDTGVIGKHFYTLIDMSDAIKYGHVSAQTLAWWLVAADTEQARLHLFTTDQKRPKLYFALQSLIAFIHECSPNPRVWGNGASADITWLEHALYAAGEGLSIPWHYKRVRDMRTLIDAARLDLDSVRHVNGARHDALVDATWQAHAIAAATHKLNLLFHTDTPTFNLTSQDNVCAL